MKIYKYSIAKGEYALPLGAQILHIAPQNGDVCVWALVDETVRETADRIRVFTTGEDVELNADFVFHSTHLLFSDSLVIHVFVVPNEK